jgi:hypothetical protein
VSSGDTIAIFAIAVPVLMAVLGLVITNLISSNKELRAKVDAKDVIIRNKDDTIAELKRQLDKLEITGTLMHRFFSQLPKANEIPREIQP